MQYLKKWSHDYCTKTHIEINLFPSEHYVHRLCIFMLSQYGVYSSSFTEEKFSCDHGSLFSSSIFFSMLRPSHQGAAQHNHAPQLLATECGAIPARRHDRPALFSNHRDDIETVDESHLNQIKYDIQDNQMFSTIWVAQGTLIQYQWSGFISQVSPHLAQTKLGQLLIEAATTAFINSFISCSRRDTRFESARTDFPWQWTTAEY